ncbi:CRISPR-associated protein, Cas6-related [Thiorhodococcus drewsii AZ1]|uniref:CRISPR-associated protein, Cas6-related n=1 Tax=Thiorhodococcus drewsii AZ1 TaxID=765913 RepID=G2E176_9GAMM|nr:type I-MYXAN CRISPR-associated protein Cas6/Cmx6 [Thiorhodococcus drewsii]EGV31417.1 CRISPR-associated protein, Cas6-related [Thiorhodococcus drewsii AZ1]
MFWNEDESPEQDSTTDDALDILFSIDCRSIPVDHAYLLEQAVRGLVPWIAEEPGMAIHSIHVAGSQNGWERPEHGRDALLMLSRRTKLTIRAPGHRAQDLIEQLQGAQTNLAGHPLKIERGKIKPLSRETTLFSRHVTFSDDSATPIDEETFLEMAARELERIDIHIRKALCGKTLSLATEHGAIHTRSLMLAGLTREESLRLQARGLGKHPLMGCGIFIPHKGIDPVKKTH